MRRALYNPLNLSKEVKWLSGAACFAEIARCAGSWDARAIEDRLKKGALSIGGEDPDNGIRRLLRGELPSDPTIARLLATYPGMDIPGWRDHGLWVVLESATPPVPRILRALKSLSGPVRDIVIVAHDDQAAESRRAYFRHIDAAAIRALEARGGIDALLALAAIVRHCDASAIAHRHSAAAAAATMRLFADTVGVCPHLFVSWPLLLKRFIDNVWRRTSRRADEPDTPLDLKAVTKHLFEISNRARQSGLRLPPDNIVARSLYPVAQECSATSSEDVANVFERTLLTA